MNKQTITVVGGGSAGWMTANLLHHQLHQHGFTIRLIESPSIGIIGVGEGSTPQLKVLFDILGITEASWMPACDATFKHGIRFNGWTDLVHPQYDHYFHPFPSNQDHNSGRYFLQQAHMMLAGQPAMPHPDPYFLTAALAQQNKTPLHEHPELRTSYGYHFDSAKLGQFLKAHGTQRGIQLVTTTIDSVQHQANNITSVTDEQGQIYHSDWFFDCTGFDGKLIQEALGTQFIHYSDNLFNDCAVAIPTDREAQELPQTTATALPCGWAWRIPLTSRIGNGYVYSSKYCTADEAEHVLRQHLNIDNKIPARHLSMKVGRLAQHWVGNTIAVGLSQGFIEPLEATALHLVQETVTQFIGAFGAGKFSTTYQAQFNDNINARFEGVRDYIVAHYACNQLTDAQMLQKYASINSSAIHTCKTDTAATRLYWEDCRNKVKKSENLQAVLSCWDHGGDLHQLLLDRNMQTFYPTLSWYTLLAGYRRFMHQQYKDNPQTAQIRTKLLELTEHFTR
jgi:hypothetical protein